MGSISLLIPNLSQRSIQFLRILLGASEDLSQSHLRNDRRLSSRQHRPWTPYRSVWPRYRWASWRHAASTGYHRNTSWSTGGGRRRPPPWSLLWRCSKTEALYSSLAKRGTTPLHTYATLYARMRATNAIALVA